MDVRQRGTTGASLGGESAANGSTQQRPIRRTLSENKTSRGPSSGSSTWIIVVFLIVIIALFAIGAINILSSSDDSAESTRATIRRTKEEVDETQNALNAMKEENLSLKQLVASLKEKKSDIKNAEGSDAAPQDEGELMKALTRMKTDKQRKHEMIQFISKRNLLYKYGPGPHFVEMLLSFDPASNVADSTKGNDDTAILLIELAPVEQMPATVFWFLEQVNATNFDGCSFHRNAGHVVQGGPAPNFETVANERPMRKFKENGLESVPFQEYSANFPHVKYTLGYAGRPGGPDFYVSTVDNTHNHGPGGQGNYEEVGEADPCFAKVVPGFEPVVTRMHKSKVKPGNYNAMEYNIAIRRMRILTKDEADITKLAST